jgi:hypothetical protein
MSEYQDLINEYWKIANWAIRKGYLTKDDALLIARVGTRKQGYWGRHVRDLKAIITERMKRHDNNRDKG